MSNTDAEICLLAVTDVIRRVRKAGACPPDLAKRIADLNAACAQVGARR